MRNLIFLRAKTVKILLFGLVFVRFFSFDVFAQKKSPRPKTPKTSRVKPPTASQVNLPKVIQIDLPALKNLLKPNGKPLLINFWATWCDPCREEFPDLVKIAADYKDKIDVITISLDYLSEIERDVPKFLADMKAEMPAYLLKTENEDAAVRLVSKNWQGALPFTVLFDETGKEFYFRQGKFKTEILRGEIEKSLLESSKQKAFEKGKEDAQKDIKTGVFIFKGVANRRTRLKAAQVKESYGITINSGVPFICSDNYECLKFFEYVKGYNSVSEVEIEKKTGKLETEQLKNSFKFNASADVVDVTLTVNRKQ